MVTWANIVSDRGLLVLAATLLPLGVALLAAGWWWDRSRGRARCPKCWYLLAGLEPVGDVSARVECPECGVWTTSARNRRGVRRQRAFLWLGALLLVVGVCMGLLRAGRERTFWPLLPGPVVFGALSVLGPRELAPRALISDATVRLLEGRATVRQARRFAVATAVRGEAALPRAAVVGLAWPMREVESIGGLLGPRGAWARMTFVRRVAAPVTERFVGLAEPPMGESSAPWLRMPVVWGRAPSATKAGGAELSMLRVELVTWGLSRGLDGMVIASWTERLPVVASVEELREAGTLSGTGVPAVVGKRLLDVLRPQLIFHPAAQRYALMVRGLDGTASGDVTVRRKLAMGLRLEILRDGRTVATARWVQSYMKPGALVLLEGELAEIDAMGTGAGWTVRLSDDAQLSQLGFVAARVWRGVEESPADILLN